MDLRDRLRVDHPVAQAGMAGMSPAELAGAMARAEALYAGESALRIGTVLSAAEAVAALTP